MRTHLVLIIGLLLLAVEERIDIYHLQLAHAVGLADDGLHLLIVRLQRLHERRVRARHDALQLNLPRGGLAVIFHVVCAVVCSISVGC